MPTINDLRATLFDTLQAVKSGDMDVDRAKAVCETSQTIINTAKAEIDYAKATGCDIRSELIEADRHRAPVALPPRPTLAGQMAAAGGSKA